MHHIRTPADGFFFNTKKKHSLDELNTPSLNEESESHRNNCKQDTNFASWSLWETVYSTSLMFFERDILMRCILARGTEGTQMTAYCRHLIKYYEGTWRLFVADKAFGSVYLASKCTEWGVRCLFMTQCNRAGWPKQLKKDGATTKWSRMQS